MFLDNGWSTFDINEKTVFSNGSRSLPRSPPVCIILCNCIFDSFILADELFTKALQIFATCLLVNNNSCRKLVLPLELPIMFDDNFIVNSFAFFVVDFTLLSCEFINFAFTLYWVILYYYYIKPKVLCLSLLVSNYNTLTESKNSSRIKLKPLLCFHLGIVKVVCWAASGFTLCCLLTSITINLCFSK